jgi:hypothetical protein
MADEPSPPRAHGDLDRILDLLHTTVERTYKTIERATSQGTKILATAHAGLGVILAAWLQRILEGPGAYVGALASYIAAALFAVMLTDGCPSCGRRMRRK